MTSLPTDPTSPRFTIGGSPSGNGVETPDISVTRTTAGVVSTCTHCGMTSDGSPWTWGYRHFSTGCPTSGIIPSTDVMYSVGTNLAMSDGPTSTRRHQTDDPLEVLWARQFLRMTGGLPPHLDPSKAEYHQPHSSDPPWTPWLAERLDQRRKREGLSTPRRGRLVSWLMRRMGRRKSKSTRSGGSKAE